MSLQFRRSHPAPSRNRPCTWTPSAGDDDISSFIILVTSLASATLSRLQLFAEKNILPQDFALESKPRLFFFFYLQYPLNKDIVRSPFIFQRLLHGPNNVGSLFGCCLSQLCSVSFGILDNMQVDYKERHVMETFGHKRITWQFDKR